jgi:hypothetical protein
MIFTVENRGTLRNTYPSAAMSTTNSICTDLSVNQDLCGERPVINCLSHGIAFNYNLSGSLFYIHNQQCFPVGDSHILDAQVCSCATLIEQSS